MRTYRSFGPLGLIVLLFGVIAGFISGDWSSVYVLAHLILGGMMLALYFFTHVDTLKASVGGRQAKHGTNALVYTLLTFGVIIVLNYLAVQHSTRWDVSEDSVFSLAPQSLQLLDGLEQDVVARAFYREGEDVAVRDLLDSYAAASDRFSYEIVDPDKRPEMAEQYGITAYSTLHVTAGDDDSSLTEVTEESLTNALLRLTAARRKVAYFVTGHGEPDMDDAAGDGGFGQAKEALDNEGFDVEPLVLGAVPDVPGDADLLILAGPKRPVLDREIEVLDRFLKRGGKALLMVDPQAGLELSSLLAERGIEIEDDVIIEQFVQLFAGAQLGLEPIVGDYGDHPITSGFAERTIFRLARSVTPIEPPAAGVDVSILASTSSDSWAERDLALLFESGEVSLDDDDRGGPISLALAATLREDALQWTAPLIASTGDADAAADESAGVAEAAPVDARAPSDLEGRLVVFGDSDWVTNRSLSLYYNRDLFLNAVGWLAGEEELISIRPRGTRASSVMLTAGESQVIFYVTVLLLPELILFFGMLIWLGRRYR